MRYFQNPILSGFHPDPSLCWVNDDCYLVTSSFEYGPGLPIFQSRDLVHWRQVGHVLTRPAQLPLSEAAPSGGIYAPTIRYYQGTFYIITTNVTHGGNFVVTAQDSAGPWSDPFWIAGAEGIDPSLFFDDDGRCWYTGNGNPVESLYEGHHTVWLQEFDPSEMRLIGEKFVIVDGGSDITQQPIWIEGPHLYKIEGRYYLLAAEGGTGENHSVVIFRSDNVTGPYESYAGNPILTNRDIDLATPSPITCTGHADLCQTPQGEWWMTLLACRPYPPTADGCYNTGRETFLVPMDWADGWPITRDRSGVLLHAYPAPNLPEHTWEDDYGSGEFEMRDNFDALLLNGRWNFLRTTEHTWANLSARRGFLRLTLRPEQITEPGIPSFVGLRQRHATFCASTALDFSPAAEYETAGIAVIQNNTAFYLIE
jgi:xylan 1,4-beta-xylosidase